MLNQIQLVFEIRSINKRIMSDGKSVAMMPAVKCFRQFAAFRKNSLLHQRDLSVPKLIQMFQNRRDAPPFIAPDTREFSRALLPPVIENHGAQGMLS